MGTVFLSFLKDKNFFLECVIFDSGNYIVVAFILK